MLLILSPASVQSRNVRNEVAFALDEQKAIIPILYQDCRVPLQLLRIQHLDFRTDYTRGLKALLKILGVQQSPEPSTRSPAPARKRNLAAVADPSVGRRGAGQARRDKERQKVAIKARLKQDRNRAAKALRKAAVDDEEPGPVFSVTDPKLKKWVAKGEGELRTLQGHSDSVLSVAVSGDKRLAVSTSAVDRLKVWNLQTGVELYTLPRPRPSRFGFAAVAMSSDGRRAVSAASFDKTLVLDVEGKRELHALSGDSSYVSGIAMSADGRLAVSIVYIDGDQSLRVWDLDGGRELRTFSDSSFVDGVAMSADGRLAVSFHGERELRVWDVQSGRELRTLQGHSKVKGVAENANGSVAISAFNDKTLGVWNMDSGRQLRTLEGHFSRVTGVAVSADGRIAVSASEDRTLRLWDVDGGRELVTFTTYVDLLCCAISLDGKTIVAGDKNGDIHYLRCE
jgi:WD40 repeat protein